MYDFRTRGEGLSPLHLAVSWEKHRVAELLLGFGADLLCYDHLGRTPLDTLDPDCDPFIRAKFEAMLSNCGGAGTSVAQCSPTDTLRLSKFHRGFGTETEPENFENCQTEFLDKVRSILSEKENVEAEKIEPPPPWEQQLVRNNTIQQVLIFEQQLPIIIFSASLVKDEGSVYSNRAIQSGVLIVLT